MALALAVVYRPRLFELYASVDYLLTVLAVVWLGALQCGVGHEPQFEKAG